MSDELEVLKLVARHLDAAGTAYMLSGSVAMSVYAQPRMTRDIDIVVELKLADAARMADLFGAEFYCDLDAIREAISRRTLFNLIHFERVVKVDFIVRKDTQYREVEFARRRLLTIDGQNIWVGARSVRPARGGPCMNDTSPDVADLYRRLLMHRSPAERLRMACGMFDAARQLMCSTMTADALAYDELRAQIFLRTYASDFDAGARARIVAGLRAYRRRRE